MQCRLDTQNRQIDETLVSDVDDILMIIKSDYEKAYFVTGTVLYLFLLPCQKLFSIFCNVKFKDVPVKVKKLVICEAV